MRFLGVMHDGEHRGALEDALGGRELVAVVDSRVEGPVDLSVGRGEFFGEELVLAVGGAAAGAEFLGGGPAGEAFLGHDSQSRCSRTVW